MKLLSVLSDQQKKKSFLKDCFFKSPAKKNQFQSFSVAMSLLHIFALV